MAANEPPGDFDPTAPWIPGTKKDLGQFNVFHRDPHPVSPSRPTFSRREYYKIALMVGRTRIHYADRVVETPPVSLRFSSPLIPYWWEHVDHTLSGYFCVFTPAFFESYGPGRDYPVFLPGRNHIFAVDDEQWESIAALYRQMLHEISSEYLYKYDVLRSLTLDLVHHALKREPAAVLLSSDSNAARRIAALFCELLERQFPIESPSQRVGLRTPGEFAAALAVHVNHLNRSLMEVTGKTTSQWISDRIGQEARILLKQTTWNVSEIGFALGWGEPGHFIHFFKKHFAATPKAFRSQSV